MNWIRWQGRLPDRSGNIQWPPPSVGSLTAITRDVGVHVVMFKALIIKVTAKTDGHKVTAANHGSNLRICWWEKVVKEAIKRKSFSA